MKRSFLEKFDLEKEQIDAILDENGKDLSSKDAKISQLEEELATTKAEVDDFKTKANEAEKLENSYQQTQEEVETLKKELNQQKIERALIEAGAIELDYLKYKLGEVDADSDDISEKISGLKDEYTKFFKSETSAVEPVEPKESKGYKVVDTKLDNGDGKPKLTRKEIMAIEDVNERRKAIAENPQEFN